MARARFPRPMYSEHEKDLQLARRDALNAFMIWVCLEGISFLVSPKFQFLPGGNKVLTWFILSISLGVLGAVLIGVSSFSVKRIQEKVDRSAANKPLLVVLAQAVGWVGLLGVGLPMGMVGLELLISLQKMPQ